MKGKQGTAVTTLARHISRAATGSGWDAVYRALAIVAHHEEDDLIGAAIGLAAARMYFKLNRPGKRP